MQDESKKIQAPTGHGYFVRPIGSVKGIQVQLGQSPGPLPHTYVAFLYDEPSGRGTTEALDPVALRALAALLHVTADTLAEMNRDARDNPARC